MKCHHCGVWFHDMVRVTRLDEDGGGTWGALTRKCSSCSRLMIALARIEYVGPNSQAVSPEIPVWPRTTRRDPVPAEVPTEIAKDYGEACLVLTDSLRASAALSRRCLQHILREKAGGKRRNLAEEIEVAKVAGLPSHIADVLDEVRTVGNFAAHPEKDERTGEIVSVGPMEADHNLDVIEALFDHFFVQPAKTKERRDALNRKLVAAGKEPLGDGHAERADDSRVAESGPPPHGD